jgi:hypothetical protein
MLSLRIPKAEQVKPKQIRITPVSGGEAKAVETGSPVSAPTTAEA